MTTLDLDKSIQYIKGVGPKRYKTLTRLGIYTPRDLLYYFPRAYQDRSQVVNISELVEGDTTMVQGKVTRVKSSTTRGWKSIFEISVTDDTGTLMVKWFNQPYLKEKFQVDDLVLLYGRVSIYKEKRQMTNPDHEFITEDGGPGESMGIVPVYALTEYMNQSTFRKLMTTVVYESLSLIEEYFPESIIQKQNLIPAVDALRIIHFPDSLDGLDEAKRRLKYEEFFLFESAMALQKREIKEVTGYQFFIDQKVESHIFNLFPFTLTKSQELVIREVHRDMCSQKPMNRLLQGDVGSGKTVVAVYALLAAIANGVQSAFMAPTELLAEQHYRTLNRYLANADIRVLLLKGGLKARERRESLEQIKSGEVDLVIGTHALIQKDVHFNRLGLIVIDEQHKFGVMQRTRLRHKGHHPHPDVLVMTATPIPRSLSLTVFGDLDVSTIDELPPGRIPVKTYGVTAGKQADAYGFIRKEVEKGRQAYVVYPLVEESEKLDLKAATEEAKLLQERVFPGLRVGLLHGQLKSDMKDFIMSDFIHHRFDILVSTIVIEVGIDVPNATIMAIEHAERFGLAQLHQLRGRVGRGSHQSYCLLFGKPKSEGARRRLKTMIATNDGFRIAEEDLRIRGPGEFFGTRQHGIPEFKIGDIIQDHVILKLAREDAFAFVNERVKSETSENRLLMKKIMENFKDKFDLIHTG
ncbi:MAG: ATP-dependent DNA helicase RecG [Candidatus Scalindua sp. AMX11]|nr:MAG: ATP-dependent DNA helicase RecG [Candidatus Scalindua sp.]NOG83538.1 ATP-dependent DNA helicase RecG [Planctomycetota bacterium]RZV72058.1 MAG: ATP-dependent DNA helicase RecG [Candidatus Scalindua sp. SCAELEC01]TDE64391.1 MAG: ATP-dependent DNA helicase RecG [Candidatus Scalindua sp. AMX11]GJQ59860.1 MAG: ATP-dependent DNA helicase RecG [Candidatus Scalindua sp.]